MNLQEAMDKINAKKQEQNNEEFLKRVEALMTEISYHSEKLREAKEALTKLVPEDVKKIVL